MAWLAEVKSVKVWQSIRVDNISTRSRRWLRLSRLVYTTCPWSGRFIIVKLWQWGRNVPIDRVLIGWDTVLEVCDQAECRVELLPDHIVVAGARCDIPDHLQLGDLESTRQEELHDCLAGKLALALRIDL